MHTGKRGSYHGCVKTFQNDLRKEMYYMRWILKIILFLELSIIVQSVNPQNYSRQPVTGLPPSSSGMLPEEDPPDLKYIF